MRVALFLTCVNDTLYPTPGRAVVKLLTRLGVDVDFPMAQTCCGQAHYNTGYRHEAEPLARQFSDVFKDYEAIVTPSGSCGGDGGGNCIRGWVSGRAPRAAATPWPGRWRRSCEDVRTDGVPGGRAGVTDVGAYYPHTVTTTTCHGLRALGLGTGPLKLLRAVKGLNWPSCRGRGVLRLRRHLRREDSDVSTAMGVDKVRNAESTGAETRARPTTRV
ncbi:(Fe-S)-binding protein [Streptomyces heliomycini]